MDATQAAPSADDVRLPLGRRVPRGQLRWYFLRVPEGREDAACDLLRRRVDRAVLRDAFVPRFELRRKVRGEWELAERQLFVGHAVAVTDDPRALARELSPLSGAAELVRPDGRGACPVAREVQEFLAASMDGRRVVPGSLGEIVGDELRVLSGPLVGREGQILRYRRRKCVALLSLGEGSGECRLKLGLSIPVRRDF